MYKQVTLALVVTIISYDWGIVSSVPSGDSYVRVDRTQKLKNFAPEPSETPQSIFEFMDEFPNKSFELLMTIHRVLGSKSLTQRQRQGQGMSMTEAVAHTLRTWPGLSSFLLMKSKHTPNKIFERIWKCEIEKPCHKVFRFFDANLEHLPSIYSVSDFRPTRIETFLLFEDICQRIKTETSPQDVRAKLIANTGSTSRSTT